MGPQLKEAQTTQNTLVEQVVPTREGFLFAKDMEKGFKAELLGTPELQESSHFFASLAAGATDCTMTVGQAFGSLEGTVYKGTESSIFMASFIDPHAKGTVDDFVQTLKVNSVDVNDTAAVKSAMQKGYNGALKAIIGVGGQHGVGGIELLNEFALLVKAKRLHPNATLVLSTNDLNTMFSKAVENAKTNYKDTQPFITEEDILWMPIDALDDKVEEMKREKQQMLITGQWPKSRSEKTIKIVLGDDVQNVKDETSHPPCGGYGYHVPGCQYYKEPEGVSDSSVQPLSSNILTNYARNKSPNTPSTN